MIRDDRKKTTSATPSDQHLRLQGTEGRVGRHLDFIVRYEWSFLQAEKFARPNNQDLWMFLRGSGYVARHCGIENLNYPYEGTPPQHLLEVLARRRGSALVIVGGSGTTDATRFCQSLGIEMRPLYCTNYYAPYDYDS